MDKFNISRAQARAFAAAVYAVTKEHLAQAQQDAEESAPLPDGENADAVEGRMTT